MSAADEASNASSLPPWGFRAGDQTMFRALGEGTGFHRQLFVEELGVPLNRKTKSLRWIGPPP